MPHKGYGQYCPLALAAELLCERWTLLIVSRLIDGCRRFNEIHRGVPKISPTLLKQRLEQLEHAGICCRAPIEGGRGHEYRLTEAGKELDPIIMSLAVWGQRWSRDLESDDLDPAFLAWSMHTRMNVDAMPDVRTVLEFEFSGTHAECRRYWLVVENGRVDMCLRHPGDDVDLTIRAPIRLFVEAWRGFRDLRREIIGGRIEVEGPAEYRRALPDWLLGSALAPFERMRPGPEHDLFNATRTATRPVAAE
ncbi:MAG TPA: helix-turn-helix domain-containing protein [Woeseiaceae bacterium]|nr:helix-turn-helix domain-containing protein [Woeseiaceae bacterium]